MINKPLAIIIGTLWVLTCIPCFSSEGIKVAIELVVNTVIWLVIYFVIAGIIGVIQGKSKTEKPPLIGKELGNSTLSRNLICPRCERVVTDNDKFCPNCGESL